MTEDTSADMNNSKVNGSTSHNEQDSVAANMMVTALSTPQLEAKLSNLRQQAQQHSSLLTQKLATSQSGQNLLHMGSSLSTLPPDLHTLLTNLHPLLSQTETEESECMKLLQQVVTHANEIRAEQRRVEHALECAELHQDLLAAEEAVKQRFPRMYQDAVQDGDEADSTFAAMDYALSLERAAHTCLVLVQDLEQSTAYHASALTRGTTEATNNNSSKDGMPSLRGPLVEPDTERAEFIMNLAPRIRKLEHNTQNALVKLLEKVLRQLQQDDEQESDGNQEVELLMIANCLRGLALLGKGKEAENVFARVAIMPLIRSKVSMGRLDEGGSRGECAGLFSLLDDMACSIAQNYGSVLELSESMWEHVDLVTAGVWVPIATALMADAAIKMAIFSPGIASILQANYTALDTFLSELASRLLQSHAEKRFNQSDEDAVEKLYFRPSITPDTVQRAQDRIYAHSMTAEFSKKWNLPIYYQLRFGESCVRLNNAIAATQTQGWIGEVYTGSEEEADVLKRTYGLELPLFLELYDILLGFWRPDVILRPLTHRFLRGAVQLIGRIVSFVGDGLEGKIKFGQEKLPGAEENGEDANNSNDRGPPSYLVRDPYCWGDNLRDVASVAWELTVLESQMNNQYIEAVLKAVVGRDSPQAERDEMAAIVKDVLKEASQQIAPIVEKCWNEVIVKILTGSCCGPLAAVKGVAATYRMTNRPPPTQASPFVATILRPLKEFDGEFKHRNPQSVGLRWKQIVVSTVASRYGVAVEDLLVTVQRTEEALKNRKARRTSFGGMSDGEKVKLQLYLDYQEFSRQVEEVGATPSKIDGIAKLKSLTIEGEKLHEQTLNGS